MDLYSSFSFNYLRPIFTTTQITALLPLLYLTSLKMPQRASDELPSKPHISDILSIKLLSSETTEMDKKTFAEQELLEGLDAHTAHADELAELVNEEMDFDKVEEQGSHE